MKTLQQHIAELSASARSEATVDIYSLLVEIVAACTTIGSHVRRLGLAKPSGWEPGTNVHGEKQTELDVFANQHLIERVSTHPRVGLIVSEEEADPIVVNGDATGEYLVAFDPLDGSSNLDVHVSVGTIFSVYRWHLAEATSGSTPSIPAGVHQLLAGYVLYGASIVLVYTTGNGVHGFTLDPELGAFVLSHPNVQMPLQGNSYSVNESSLSACPEYCRRFIESLKSATNGNAYRSRYIGSLVADFHRTLLKGGVFMYPPNSSYRDGKLRLLYEANPIAFLATQAGGLATNGSRRILDIAPISWHQCVPFFVGGKREMDRLAELAQQTLNDEYL